MKKRIFFTLLFCLTILIGSAQGFKIEAGLGYATQLDESHGVDFIDNLLKLGAEVGFINEFRFTESSY